MANDELKEKIDLLEKEGKITKEVHDELKKIENTTKRTVEDNKEHLEDLKRVLKNLENTNEIQDKATLIARQKLEVEKQELTVLQQKIKEAHKLSEEELDQYERLKQTVAMREEALGIEEEINKEITEGTEVQRQFNAHAKKMVILLEQGKLGAYGMAKAMRAIDKLSSKAITMFVTAVKDMLFQFDEVTKGFQKATQLGDEYTDSIKNTYTELNLYGVSLEEAAASTKSLVGNVTDFTLASKGQRDALIQTTARLSELGISADDTAAGVQASMKFFGQSMAQANLTAQELEATARGLGMVPGELAAEYAKSGAALAKFGDQGTRTFKDLARISKITGMDIQKLLNITNKFDTFEGAATQAGKLNAALGGNFVNAMDLMMATDPAERFSMIRDSITDAGLSFDSMSYFQRKYFAEAAGLDDVGDLALMLSGNMDMLTGAQDQNAASIIEQKKRAQEQMAVQEQLKAALLEVAEAFLPLVGYIQTFAHWVQENSVLVGRLIKAFIAWKVITVAVAGLNALMAGSFFGLAIGQEAAGKSGKKASFPLLLVAAALTAIGYAFIFGSPSRIVLAFFALAVGLYAVGTAARAVAGPLNSIVIPLLAIGATIFAVSLGISAMALAFSLLSPKQLLALYAGLAMLAGVVAILAIELPILGFAATVSASGLAIVAGVILSIGASVLMASAGIALMATSLTALFEAVSMEKVLTLGAFFAGLVIATPFLFMAAAGLTALGLGFGAMAIGLFLISSKKLASIALFTQSLASVELEHFKETAEVIERIADAMNDMPKTVMFRFVPMMDSIAMAAIALRALRGYGDARNRENTQPAQAAAAGGGGNVAEVTVNLQLDGDLLERKVIKIQREQDGIKAREIVRGER